MPNAVTNPAPAAVPKELTVLKTPMHSPGLADLADVVPNALRTYGCPSVSVAVAVDGEVAYARAWGLADAAGGRAATPDTAYGLGSVTKPMTAAAVCVALDEGLVELDVPVPGVFGPDRAAPTVRQLLQHRAGFGAFYAWDYGDGGPLVDAARYAVPYREPGSGFEYANLGYRALGRLLEEASGQRLDAYLRDRVFAPLGLDRCHLGPHYPGPGPAAVRYTADGRPYPDYDCAHPGATLGWATAPQLALFGQGFEQLLTPRTAAAVRDAPPVTPHLGYGLGWCVAAPGSGPLVLTHGGGGGGVAAMLVVVPEQRLSVAVVSNSTNKAARDTILSHLLSRLIPGFRDEWTRSVAEDPAQPRQLPEGVWKGHIAAPERALPVELRIRPDDRIELLVAGERAAGPATASRKWDLSADLPLQLPTADARISSPRLMLNLRGDSAAGPGRGSVLTGVACAYKGGDAEGLLGNFLSHPCRLEPS